VSTAWTLTVQRRSGLWASEVLLAGIRPVSRICLLAGGCYWLGRRHPGFCSLPVEEAGKPAGFRRTACDVIPIPDL
jgi:hypothetical protein